MLFGWEKNKRGEKHHLIFFFFDGGGRGEIRVGEGGLRVSEAHAWLAARSRGMRKGIWRRGVRGRRRERGQWRECVVRGK